MSVVETIGSRAISVNTVDIPTKHEDWHKIYTTVFTYFSPSKKKKEEKKKKQQKKKRLQNVISCRIIPCLDNEIVQDFRSNTQRQDTERELMDQSARGLVLLLFLLFQNYGV